MGGDGYALVLDASGDAWVGAWSDCFFIAVGGFANRCWESSGVSSNGSNAGSATGIVSGEPGNKADGGDVLEGGAEPPAGDPGLGGAAKTGIEIGIAIFLVFLVALLLVFIRKHRAQRLNRQGAVAPQPTRFARAQELHSQDHRPGELPDKSTWGLYPGSSRL